MFQCDDNRDYIIQFWPPDDEHMCSKQIETWNKLIVKQKILCIKLVNYRDKYTEMHGQQNDKYTEMHGQQNDKYTEMHGQQNIKKKFKLVWVS